jgi:hypothetical protein
MIVADVQGVKAGKPFSPNTERAEPNFTRFGKE